MKIDWDAVLSRMPIYAYEYEQTGLNIMTPSIDYWYPHLNPPGAVPPKGHTGIDYDLSYEGVVKAIEAWVKEELKPNEKAVWLNTADGHFSNTFRMGAFDAKTLEHLNDPSAWEQGTVGFKLIIYRCQNDENFEFSDMMKIVTKTKEERRRK